MSTVRKRKSTAGKRGGFRTLWHRAGVTVLLFATFLVMVFGLFLPSLLMGRQQKRLERQMIKVELGADVYAATGVSFEGEAVDFRKLSALVNARYNGANVVVHEALDGEMTEAVALTQAGRELHRMTEAGLIPAYCADLEGAQYTALLSTYYYNERAAQPFSTAYDFWDISFYKTDMMIHLQLDVTSGVIIYLEASVGSTAMSTLYDFERYLVALHTYGVDEPEVAIYDLGEAETDNEAYLAYGYDTYALLSGRLTDGRTFQNEGEFPDGTDIEDIEELTIDLYSGSTLIGSVTLKSELELITFFETFDPAAALTVYVTGYLGYTEEGKEAYWFEPESATMTLENYNLFAELQYYWDGGSCYLEYRLE